MNKARTRRSASLAVHLLGSLVLMAGLAGIGRAADKRLEKLSPEHRKWLEEEVVYIITDQEKDIFLSLNTLEERNAFIEAFWRKRDPNPATPQNEFKDEHYRRIEHANKFLGRETFRQGWRTDRGRMYILLGEPRETQRFDGYNELTASELWFYEGDVSKGLPSFFYLLFFKRHGVGEYQLYHPIADGPQALLRGQYTPNTDNLQAIEALEQISPELAQASLSFDTGDPPDLIGGRPSIGTDIMLARIYDSPKRAIRPDYAEGWQRYGKRVSAEYSFNYVANRNLFTVITGPDGIPFVHYTLEIDPQNFSMETDEDRTKFYTTLDVSIEAKDGEGRVVVANDKEVYLELTPSQVETVKASPFAFQDSFPLVAGDYTVSVILRNRVLKQYTVAERELHVEPLASDRPRLSQPVLGYASEPVSGRPGGSDLRVFQQGGVRVHPAADSVFPIGESVHVFLQVAGAGPDFRLRFRLLNGEQVVQERLTQVGDYQGGSVLEQIPLNKIVGGEYTIRVELIEPPASAEAAEKVVAAKTAAVVVSPRSAIPRPWVYRRSFNIDEPGLLSLALGEQLLIKRQTAAARVELEKAVAAGNPKLPMARWRLAAALLDSGEADRVFELLTPLEAQYPNQYEVVAYLGVAHYLKQDFEKAISYLERSLSIRPPTSQLLNALGDSYLKVGKEDKARETFQRSLELDAEQTNVKERLQSLGKSK
jgi:GWxTD domain-containing protein